MATLQGKKGGYSYRKEGRLLLGKESKLLLKERREAVLKGKEGRLLFEERREDTLQGKKGGYS